MSKAPKPVFVMFGIQGGASCCHVEADRMFIGSQMGSVGVYGVETKILEETAYVDEDRRRIQSLQFSDNHLFVHIRGHAILRLTRPEPPFKQWQIVSTIDVDHVGFCNSLLVGERLLTVSSDEHRFATLCWMNISAETPTENQSIRTGDSAADVMPMHMTRGEDEVLIGMEDGRLAVFRKGTDGFECSEMIKLGREPIFCVASCSKWIVAGCARAPIYLMSREDKKPREVFYPPDSAGCSSITFSPTEKQILAGFWDGSMRVFSCQRLSVLLALSSTHTSSITSLVWRRPEEGEVVIATSSDATVSMWKLR